MRSASKFFSIRYDHKLLLIAFLLAVLPRNTSATTPSHPASKGSFFVYWGYNRSMYSWSDIHFDGSNYDFTLRHVKASDRQVPFSVKEYFNPKNIWIPQYNYRIGYFLKDRWAISLGLDHMKYVVDQGQTVRMDGSVSPDRSARYGSDVGLSRDVVIEPELLTYEHSDGLNLLSVDLDHYDLLWMSKNERYYLRAYEGLHVGPVIPRTDVRLFGEGINNRFNIAGYGVGAQVGLHLTFLKHFFLRNTLKAGWIDLPNVLTTGKSEDHAGQHFWFVQHAVVLGGQFRIWSKHE
ncbi:MAG: hypothetical protein IPO10_17735 [Flavobacteriales bacterium]|nr:hypothetical protein [Flavobacteriales bacterium]